jgi:ATP-dependent exoDNAse (exonuclease V) beta subunit
MTIHKAKGLEMDNVIVYNAKYTSWGDPASRVRVYYVAFSRAKKRLTVFYSDSIDEAVGSVKHLFKAIPPIEIKYMAMQENFLGNNGFPQILP